MVTWNKPLSTTSILLHTFHNPDNVYVSLIANYGFSILADFSNFVCFFNKKIIWSRNCRLNLELLTQFPALNDLLKNTYRK